VSNSPRWRPFRRKANDSTLARIDLARRNEDLVLAESALAGERVVAAIRCVFPVILVALQQVATETGVQGEARDLPRAVGFGIYELWAIVVLVRLWRAKPSARQAMWIPMGMMAIDFAFFTFAGWRSYASGHTYLPETGAAIFALLLCLSVARFSWVHVFASCFLACCCYMGLARLGPIDAEHMRAHYLVIAAYMSFAAFIGATQGRVRGMFVKLRRRDMLSRFLPKQVADRVMEYGDESLMPAQREVTLMFTDIRDFTSMSEHLPPNAVLSFLDEYFGHMSQVVKAHDGLVNKFIGDGMLAVWGVPERVEDHAARAVRAALDMRKVVEELNQVRARQDAPRIRIGVGIHTGDVAAGMLGGVEQHEYTVIGDAVNLASRIEGLTKQHAVDVLVSESTWALVEARFSGARVGECRVKGRTEPVVVYRIDGPRAADAGGGGAKVA